MAIYFFDLHEGGDVTADAEGCEAESLAVACAMATRAARGIMSAELLCGRLSLKPHIIIRNDGHHKVGLIRFCDALAIVAD